MNNTPKDEAGMPDVAGSPEAAEAGLNEVYTKVAGVAGALQRNSSFFHDKVMEKMDKRLENDQQRAKDLPSVVLRTILLDETSDSTKSAENSPAVDWAKLEEIADSLAGKMHEAYKHNALTKEAIVNETRAALEGVKGLQVAEQEQEQDTSYKPSGPG